MVFLRNWGYKSYKKVTVILGRSEAKTRGSILYFSIKGWTPTFVRVTRNKNLFITYGESDSSNIIDINLMKKRIYLLTILIIFLSSITSALLLFSYMNPENNILVGLTTMSIACFLAGSSFFTLFLYLFKKIYYRGEVYIHTIHSSLRQ